MSNLFAKAGKICAGLLLISAVRSFAEEKPFMKDMSDALSGQEFQEIARFILDNGDRKTFCEVYQNNPHYRSDDMIDIYLNPVSSEKDLSEKISASDYNAIHIWAINADLILSEGKVYYEDALYRETAYRGKDYMDLNPFLQGKDREGGHSEYALRKLVIPKLKALIGKEDFLPDMSDWVDMSGVFGKQDIEALMKFVGQNGDCRPWSQRFSSIHYRFQNFDMFIDQLFLYLSRPANAPDHDRITITYHGYLTMYIINEKLYARSGSAELLIEEIIPEIKETIYGAKGGVL
jgi:hypothetical protein